MDPSQNVGFGSASSGQPVVSSGVTGVSGVSVGTQPVTGGEDIMLSHGSEKKTEARVDYWCGNDYGDAGNSGGVGGSNEYQRKELDEQWGSG